jgi:DNA polymerase III epsilon subunit-like protein
MNIMCFDTETGGLNPYTDGLCSVTLQNINKEETKTIFIKPNPELNYNPDALRVNGLTLQELEEKGVSEPEAIKQIIIYLKQEYGSFKPCLLAHNIVFDIQFMNALFYRNKMPLFQEFFWGDPKDTMIIISYLKEKGLNNFDKLNLQSVHRALFGELFKNAHTSEADVLATTKIYKKLINKDVLF